MHRISHVSNRSIVRPFQHETGEWMQLLKPSELREVQEFDRARKEVERQIIHSNQVFRPFSCVPPLGAEYSVPLPYRVFFPSIFRFFSYSVVLYSVVLYSVVLYSVVLYSVLLYSVLLGSVLLHGIPSAVPPCCISLSCLCQSDSVL